MENSSARHGDSAGPPEVGLFDDPAFLEALFYQGVQGVVIVDLNGIVEEVNPAALHMLKAERCAVVGKPLVDLIDAPFRTLTGRIVEILPQHATDPESRICVQAIRSNGETFPADISFSMVEASGARRLVMFLRDATDRIQAELATRRALDVLDATPDLVAWGRLDGGLTYLNRHGREILGVGPDGDSRTIIDLFAPEERGRISKEVLPTALSKGLWFGETLCLGPEGTPVPMSVVLVSDAVEGYVAVVARDISYRKEMEKIQEAFISSVSHELRTPLTAIVGFLELVLEDESLTEEQREMLDAVARSSDRLVHLVGSILTVSRLQRPEECRHEVIELGDLAKSIVGALADSAVQKGVDLRLDVEANHLEVNGDREDLRSAIVNIIENGLKFTAPNGKVQVTVDAVDSAAVIEVADTGIGIPPEECGRVFEDFYRATNAQGAQMPGTGLGLSIADSVVKRHGGKITVESEVNRGSTFRIVIPATN